MFLVAIPGEDTMLLHCYLIKSATGETCLPAETIQSLSAQIKFGLSWWTTSLKAITALVNIFKTYKNVGSVQTR